MLRDAKSNTLSLSLKQMDVYIMSDKIQFYIDKPNTTLSITVHTNSVYVGKEYIKNNYNDVLDVEKFLSECEWRFAL